MTEILRSPNLRDGEVPLVVRVYAKPPPTAFKNGGLAHAARSVQSAGRGGDDILLHVNPQEYEYLQHVWGEPSKNPHTGLPEYGLFSKLKKALKFEVFNTKGIVKNAWKHPLQGLTGIDPIHTKLSNKVLGTNYKPWVNQLGGATEETFADAEAKGMDTGTARDLHKVAAAVAAYYGTQGLGNLASAGLSNIAAANTLGPVVTTVEGTNTISPVVTTAGQTSTNAIGNLANTGSGALSNLGGKAIDYAKQPKNWANIAKAAGALGALGGAGGNEEGAAPEAPTSPGLKILPYGREQTDQNFDWYTYGQGPEQQFYSGNALPAFDPNEEEKVPGAKHGGAFSGAGGEGSGAGASGSWEQRFVRGPGTGRSDSIDAKLSDGEYVLTAEDVAMLGDGSSDAGAKRLDQFRANLRKHKGGALAKGKISPNAKSPMAYLKGN